jgi:AcrR family transcriptional regulator
MASSAETRALRRPSVRLPQEKRVADIMAAARQVVAEKGYENALMSDIAERAGIVEGSLYRYFDNKRDLLTKVVDDWFEEVLSIDSGVASIRGTWNKVRHLTWRALSAVRNQPALSRYMLLEIRRDPDYRNTRSFSLNRRFTGEFTEVFEEAIASGEFRRDVSVPLLRDMVFGCIEHSTWKFLRGEGDFSLEEVSDGIANLVVRGMTVEVQSAPPAQLDAVTARLEKAASDMEALLRRERT